MIQQTILLIAPIGHQFGDESLCEDLVEIRGSLRLIKKSPPCANRREMDIPLLI